MNFGIYVLTLTFTHVKMKINARDKRNTRNKNKIDLKRQTLCLNKNQDSTVTFP